MTLATFFYYENLSVINIKLTTTIIQADYYMKYKQTNEINVYPSHW